MLRDGQEKHTVQGGELSVWPQSIFVMLHVQPLPRLGHGSSDVIAMVCRAIKNYRKISLSVLEVLCHCH